MKYVFFLLMLPCAAFSQEYVSLSGIFIPNAGTTYSGGGLLAAGKFINGATIGLGGGALIFEEEDPYIPVYADFGYIGAGKKKLAPYFNAKLGWSFYEGSAAIVGERGTAKGGIFANISAGGNYLVTRSVRVGLHAGVMAIMLRKKFISKTETYSNSLFNAGLTITHAR